MAGSHNSSEMPNIRYADPYSTKPAHTAPLDMENGVLLLINHDSMSQVACLLTASVGMPPLNSHCQPDILGDAYRREGTLA